MKTRRIGACSICGGNMACCSCRNKEKDAEFEAMLIKVLIEMGLIPTNPQESEEASETQYHLHPFGY